MLPEIGYRDWDDMAKVYFHYRDGYVWANERTVLGDPEMDNNKNKPNGFMYSRSQKYVYPVDQFIATDGMPVRCVKIK